jgi:hypothetical protein
MNGSMRKPSFLGIGASKAGTSSLRYYLKQHPEIFIPDDEEREPGYFCRGGDDSSIFYRVKTPEAYFGMFRGAGDAKAWGEITPHYLDSPYAAQNIRDEIPEARLIVSIRNPVERAFSLYQMNLRNKNHNRGVPFLEAAARDPWMQSAYFEGLSRFYRLFPRERILLVLFDELSADPAGTVRRVFAFLGVGPDFEPDVSKVVNPGGLPRSRLLHLALTNRTSRRVGRHIVPMSVQNRLERLKNDNLQVQRLNPEERREAAALFRDDILRTQDLIGRDLSGWMHA